MPFIVAVKKNWNGDFRNGGSIDIDSRYRPKQVFATRAEADDYAQLCAQENPQTPVYIFEAVGVVETAAPTFIQKRFTPSGELLPV